MTVNNINNNELSGSSRLGLDQAASTSRTSGTGAGQSTGGVGAGADSIALTGTSNLVQQALHAGSDARAARVQELKALVQSNQYLPSAQEVSGALIDAHIAGF